MLQLVFRTRGVSSRCESREHLLCLQAGRTAEKQTKPGSWSSAAFPTHPERAILFDGKKMRKELES